MADVCNCADPAIICDGRGKWCRICGKSERYELTRPAPSPSDADLIRRLRGEYRIPITDGLGAAGGEEPDNPNEFVRRFETPPIQREAANRIEALARMRGAAAPEGWKLVPVQLTEDMAAALELATSTEQQWADVLAAAPKPEVPR